MFGFQLRNKFSFKLNLLYYTILNCIMQVYGKKFK